MKMLCCLLALAISTHPLKIGSLVRHEASTNSPFSSQDYTNQEYSPEDFESNIELESSPVVDGTHHMMIHSLGEVMGEMSPAVQQKMMGCMIQDNKVRKELIDNIVKSSPEMAWLAKISPKGQKQVLSVFMKYGSDQNSDPQAMMTELQKIPQAKKYFASMSKPKHFSIFPSLIGRARH